MSFLAQATAAASVGVELVLQLDRDDPRVVLYGARIALAQAMLPATSV